MNQFHLRFKMVVNRLFYVPIPWQPVYELIYKTTNDTSILFNLKFSSQKECWITWGIEQSALCRLEETESIDLFWWCPSVARLWSQVQEWFLSYNVCVLLDLQKVLLEDLKNHHQSMRNMIPPSGKAFILRAISVERFTTLIRHHSKIEWCITQGNSHM